MRPVHIVGVGSLPNALGLHEYDEAEMVQAAVAQAYAESGLTKKDVGFVCSGSSDYVMGRPFSFATAIDGVGLWPPMRESHVEMDGAWALYEAFIRLQHGDVDVALVYSYGKGHGAPVDTMLTLQTDPYYVAPLAPSPMSMAALQARTLLDRGLATERDFATVVARDLAAASRNPSVPKRDVPDVDALLAAPYVSSPLRAHDQALRTDGVAAVLLAVGGKGPRLSGIAHCIEAQDLGMRDLADSASTRRAREMCGLDGMGRLDAVELHACYSPQDLILRRALGLDDGVTVNASGGAMGADSPFVTGLTRIIEATRQVRAGADRVLAHATTGPCLQHNLLAVLEAR